MSGYNHRSNRRPTAEAKKAIRVSPEVKALLDQAKKAIANRDAALAKAEKEKEELRDERDKQTRLLSNANARINKLKADATKRDEQEQTRLEEEQAKNAELLSRLQEAYAKNNTLIHEAVYTEQ